MEEEKVHFQDLLKGFKPKSKTTQGKKLTETRDNTWYPEWCHNTATPRIEIPTKSIREYLIGILIKS